MLFCIILPAELVEADALHAPLSDNAPATPNAATVPFRPLPLLEVRLSPDIGWLLLVLDTAISNFAWPSFQDFPVSPTPACNYFSACIPAGPGCPVDGVASRRDLWKRARPYDAGRMYRRVPLSSSTKSGR